MISKIKTAFSIFFSYVIRACSYLIDAVISVWQIVTKISTLERRTQVENQLVDYIREQVQTIGTLPRKIFGVVAEYLRLTAVEVVFLKQEGGAINVLLSRRAVSDPSFPEQWHSIGGIVLIEDNTPLDAAHRVIKKELEIDPCKLTLIPVGGHPIFSKHARGGEAHIIFVCILPEDTMLPERCEFHPYSNLPTPFMEHHRQIIDIAIKWYRQMY